MSDIKTVTQKINDAIWEVTKLKLNLVNTLESIQVRSDEEPQPEKENTTVSQPDPEETQKVPTITANTSVPGTATTPTVFTTGGGNFSA